MCVFAHGASGSGKTHTMVGPLRARGIAYRALHELMELAVRADAELDVVVDATMVEIYNGAVRDLAADAEGEASAVAPGKAPLSVRAAPRLIASASSAHASARPRVPPSLTRMPTTTRRCACATWTTLST